MSRVSHEPTFAAARPPPPNTMLLISVCMNVEREAGATARASGTATGSATAGGAARMDIGALEGRRGGGGGGDGGARGWWRQRRGQPERLDEEIVRPQPQHLSV